jgi:hypothetical protein
MAGRISPGPASTAAALTPGPGAYPKAAAAVDATLPGQPAFTMGVRPNSPGGGAGDEGGGRTASPGPGQYDPADVDASSAPAWTMGAKLKPPGGMEAGVAFSVYQGVQQVGLRQYIVCCNLRQLQRTAQSLLLSRLHRTHLVFNVQVAAAAGQLLQAQAPMLCSPHARLAPPSPLAPAPRTPPSSSRAAGGRAALGLVTTMWRVASLVTLGRHPPGRWGLGGRHLRLRTTCQVGEGAYYGDTLLKVMPAPGSSAWTVLCTTRGRSNQVVGCVRTCCIQTSHESVLEFTATLQSGICEAAYQSCESCNACLLFVTQLNLLRLLLLLLLLVAVMQVLDTTL